MNCIRSYTCLWYSWSWETCTVSLSLLTRSSYIRVHKRDRNVWKLKQHLGRWVVLPASSQISCTPFFRHFYMCGIFLWVFEKIQDSSLCCSSFSRPPYPFPLYPTLLQTFNEIYCLLEGYVYAVCSSEEEPSLEFWRNIGNRFFPSQT